MALRDHIAKDESGTRISWLVALGLSTSDNGFICDAQIAKIRRTAAIWPASLFALLIGLGCIAAPLILASDYVRLADASVPAGALMLISIVALLLFRTSAFWKFRPDRQTWCLLPIVIGLGAATVAVGWQTTGIADGSISLAGAIGIAGLSIAGIVILMALLSMPAAMLAFAASAIATIAYLTGGILVGAIGAVLIACLWVMSSVQARYEFALSRSRHRQEQISRRANRLLTAFEANGNGWFWETDRRGNLVYLSDRLAAAIGETAENLIGRPLNSIICAEEGAQDGERTLGFHLTSRNPFADVTVRAALDEEERWWSISGRPIIDDIGQFRGFVGSGTDLTEKRRSQAEATRLARYDELTGLANRQEMRLALTKALTDERGQHREVSLMLLDLDRFKTVNDTMGHPVGDVLLQQVAQRLLRTVDEAGMVGRLGGDEFQVVLPGLVSNKALTELAKMIIAALSQPYMIDGATVSIGCSIGIAVAPANGETSQELVRNADLALYAAKGDGRGVHRFYEREMHSGAKKRKRLEDDLRTALSNGELHLTYQPVVSTETTKIVGYEALIRWNHPSRGAISPADFIPVAEDIRLIEQIGEWVLRTACADATTWPGHLRVAVNLSPIQFANPTLPALITNVLAQSGLAPGRLELELTEGVFVDEGINTDMMFSALKKLGVRLALDDFGTGYSSLGYLKKAPFDKIKIDQSFIRGAAVTGNRNAAIIKAIVTLANTLDMETTAEGVEHEDEIELIHGLGCSHIQGYIYGKPMRIEETHKQLAEGGGQAIASGYRASRSPRTQMLRSAGVTHGNQQRTVRIRNLSSTGAMVEGLSGVDIDSDVLIELLENQMFPATVRWSEANRAGIEFARGFDLDRLSAPDQRQKTQARRVGLG